MRIKFLSLIASFFIVSLVVTSCLGENDPIEYSSDAAIRTFELDTVYGVTYKFTIDQLKGEIYNIDSMPVHSDTIIDKILISKLSIPSGLVSIKSYDGLRDSVINISKDSLDFRNTVKNPLKLTVWAPDMVTRKEYKISVRVHKHDPDSLRWSYLGNITNSQISGEQKSVLMSGNIYTYSVSNGSLKVYKTSLNSGTSWTSNNVTGLTALPTSLINYQNSLYATSNGKVVTSTDGISWVIAPEFGNNVDLLLAPFNTDITYTKMDGNSRFFYSKEKGKKEEVPTTFPIRNISFANYQTATGINSILLVGESKESTTVGEDEKVKTTVPWGYDGNHWVSFEPNNISTNCPEIKNPSIIYYNKQFYIFGANFESFYTSKSPIAWTKANKKFSFPYRDWSVEGITPNPNPQKDPEFRGRVNYSMVLDANTQYIWIMFSKGTATFTEEIIKKDEKGKSETTTATRTYNHEDEVWRGRLNQLWFNLPKQ